MGSGLSYSVNIAAGTGGPAVAVEFACRRDTTQSSVRHVKMLRFSKASAIAKTFFYNLFTKSTGKIHCRYEAPREEPREAHRCLAIGWKATWLRHHSILVDNHIVGKCKNRAKSS
jgi:hypothetical protein